MRKHLPLILAAASAVSLPVFAAEPTISFYFTNEAVLQQHEEAGSPAAAQKAATREWFARCVAGGEFADLAGDQAPNAAMSIDERKTQGAAFDRVHFERIARDAWIKANAELPQDSVHVCVDLAPAKDTFTRDRMDGIMAMTAGKGRILLRIHPAADWAGSLPYTLAHEMHHSYWTQFHFDADKPFTLGDYLVFEGRADYFAAQLFEHRAPWTKALDDAAYAATWNSFSKKLHATDTPTLMGSMFGSPDGGIPMWAGYSVGYKLVSDRMTRVPKLDFAAMTAAPAAEFTTIASTANGAHSASD